MTSLTGNFAKERLAAFYSTKIARNEVRIAGFQAKQRAATDQDYKNKLEGSVQRLIREIADMQREISRLRGT